MATQKQLVAAVASIICVPIETVTFIDRLLAAAGLRTRALRGRAQTQMSATDAARLLVATVAARSPRDGVATVIRFSDEVAAIALDIERAITGWAPAEKYSLRFESGEAFWVAGFSGKAVQEVANLLLEKQK